MAWEIKHEFIDLAKSRHYVVFHNKDVLELAYDGSGKMVPREHHLMYEFGLNTCPHCGQVKDPPMAPEVDFHAKKADMLAALNAHHQFTMKHVGKHPKVRLGSGPKA